MDLSRLSQLVIHQIKKCILPPKSWSDVQKRINSGEPVFLYAGDFDYDNHYNRPEYIGLSISEANYRQVSHDITTRCPLSDCCIDVFQAEDVLEHIPFEAFDTVVEEVYRILKPGGVFRISLPDYYWSVLKDRSQKDVDGNIVFDPFGGGNYVDGKVINGGHLWFPNIEIMKKSLSKTSFSTVNYLQYVNSDGTEVTHPIDYSTGWIMRTPEHNGTRSIVIDCIK